MKNYSLHSSFAQLRKKYLKETFSWVCNTLLVVLVDFEIIPIRLLEVRFLGDGSGCQGAEPHGRRGVNLPYSPVCLLPLNLVWWKFRSIFLASQLCSSLVRIRRTEGLAHYISSELRESFALSSTSSFKIEKNSLRIVFWWGWWKLIIK